MRYSLSDFSYTYSSISGDERDTDDLYAKSIQFTQAMQPQTILEISIRTYKGNQTINSAKFYSTNLLNARVILLNPRRFRMVIPRRTPISQTRWISKCKNLIRPLDKLQRKSFTRMPSDTVKE